MIIETPITYSQDIVSPDWLVNHLTVPHLRILDARLPEDYAESHIPHAVHIDLRQLEQVQNGVKGFLASPQVFASTMEQAGVDHQTRVVIYDNYHGMMAARLAWALMHYGHQQVVFLDGGWDIWEQNDYPISCTPAAPVPTKFDVRLVDRYLAERLWILDHIDDADVILLDVRSIGEYRQGHLPGAISWEWLNGTDSTGLHTFRSADELLSGLEQHQVTPDKTIVTYCQTGVRSAHTFWLLWQLGFQDVRNYDGSWQEWSRFQGGN